MSRARGDSLLWFRLSGFHSTDGWKSIGRVFVLALVLDVVYQIIAEHFVYPGSDHRRDRAGAGALPDSARTGQSLGAKRMNLTDTIRFPFSCLAAGVLAATANKAFDVKCTVHQEEMRAGANSP